MQKERLSVKKFLPSDPRDASISLTFLSVAFIALLIGGILGMVQGLNRAGLFDLPNWFDYYQALTAHGILLVVVFTLLFVIGYYYAVLSHTTGGLLPIVRKLVWAAFLFMVIGVVFVVFQVLAGTSSVLYTFYPPMQASPWFYVGLIIAIGGSWLAALGAFIQIYTWKKANPGHRIPLLTYFAAGFFTLYFFGTIGVMIELVMLTRWAFGFTERINVMFQRTLFWSFGHTLVNTWYLTALSVWYVVVPRVIGGRLFSDTLTRLVVILLVVLNIPGGFHHQIVDPGFSHGMKLMHGLMSMAIGFPSLMTAFAMFAVFSRVALHKGVKGPFGWMKGMPWKDVRFLAPFLAMVAFIPGGLGGIVQNGQQFNQVVHNTLWITGHFHLTVGITSVLTFFGAVYWLIPYLSGRTLTKKMNRLGLIQTWAWTIGMVLMAFSMHWLGLLGAPRRTAFSTYGEHATAQSWSPYLLFLALGGTLLMVAVILIVYITFHLMFAAPKGVTEFPIALPTRNASVTPAWTDRWWIFVLLLIIIVLVGYVVPLVDLWHNAAPGSKTFITW